MENINTIHWHDAEIESVVEIPSKDQLIFNIRYPEDWNQNSFVPKAIIFNGYHSQIVEEIPFDGKPTILSASIVGKEDSYTTIKLETNAGNRYVIAKSIDIGPQCLSL